MFWKAPINSWKGLLFKSDRASSFGGVLYTYLFHPTRFVVRTPTEQTPSHFTTASFDFKNGSINTTRANAPYQNEWNSPVLVEGVFT